MISITINLQKPTIYCSRYVTLPPNIYTLTKNLNSNSIIFQLSIYKLSSIQYTLYLSHPQKQLLLICVRNCNYYKNSIKKIINSCITNEY